MDQLFCLKHQYARFSKSFAKIGASFSASSTYSLNEANTDLTAQSRHGVKRKIEVLSEDELTPASKKQKTSAIDVMSYSEPFAPLEINEVITKVKALLHQYYQTPAYAELKRLFHERTFPITESFTKLAIVKEHEQKPKEDEQLNGTEILSRDDYLNSLEMIYQPKAPINIEELFLTQGDKNQKPKCQLIEGRAGIGKTTLCQYIAHQWTAGDTKWDPWRQQFDWVIHLSLRQLTADNQYDFSKFTLVDWLSTQYMTSIEKQHFPAAEFAAAFRTLNAQGKVLLLLDGYDEIVPALKTNPSFRRFFEKELLSCTSWLVFSRPYYFTDNRVEQRLENIGFTQEDILKYVQQYFRDVENEKHISQQTYTDSLIIYLQRNPNAMGIAHIPINLELLCYAWESGKNQLDSQLTLTQLYDHLVLRLFGRYLHKYYPQTFPTASAITWIQLEQDFEYQCKAMLEFLEQLAWHQIQQPDLIIRTKRIEKLICKLYPALGQASKREVFGEMVLKHLGLLKGCDVHKPTLEQSYYFIHLTFQEYFAARYWAKLFKDKKTHSKAIKFLQVNKFNPRHEIMWWMVAGQLKEDIKKLDSFFTWLFGEKLFEFNCQNLNTKSNQLLLALRCSEESSKKGEFAPISCKKKLELLYKNYAKEILHLAVTQKHNLFSNNTQKFISYLMQSPVVLMKIGINDILLQELGPSETNSDAVYNIVWILVELKNQNLSIIKAKIIELLLNNLENNDAKVRQRSAEALISLSKEKYNNIIVKALVKNLKEIEAFHHINAANILIDLAEENEKEEVINTLRKDLENNANKKDQWIYYRAIEILKKLGEIKDEKEILDYLLTKNDFRDIGVFNDLDWSKSISNQSQVLLIYKDKEEVKKVPPKHGLISVFKVVKEQECKYYILGFPQHNTKANKEQQNQLQASIGGSKQAQENVSLYQSLQDEINLEMNLGKALRLSGNLEVAESLHDLARYFDLSQYFVCHKSPDWEDESTCFIKLIALSKEYFTLERLRNGVQLINKVFEMKNSATRYGIYDMYEIIEATRKTAGRKEDESKAETKIYNYLDESADPWVIYDDNAINKLFSDGRKLEQFFKSNNQSSMNELEVKSSIRNQK